MARDRMTRQREYDLMELDAQSRQAPAPARRYGCYEDAWERAARRNTMEPSEDVLEHRKRMRCRPVALGQAGGNSARNILRENVIMLILIIGSTYGLYRLIIHLLNQS